MHYKSRQPMVCAMMYVIRIPKRILALPVVSRLVG